MSTQSRHVVWVAGIAATIPRHRRGAEPATRGSAAD